MTEAEMLRLQAAMNWVIPADSSPGVGTSAGASRLVALIDSQEPGVAASYRASLPGLRQTDLADPSHAFAAMFIEHVRDVYYASPDTGAWQDIGFNVTG